MNRFILDGRYGDLLGFYGIRAEEALRKAGLPGDRKNRTFFPACFCVLLQHTPKKEEVQKNCVAYTFGL